MATFHHLSSDLVVRTAGFLSSINDVLALRAVCTRFRDSLDKGGLQQVIRYRLKVKKLPKIWATEELDYLDTDSDRKEHIRDLILQLTYLSSPRIFGQSLGGAWTDDNQYYSREASDLVLKYVYWVDVTGTFEDVNPGKYTLFCLFENLEFDDSLTVKLSMVNKDATLKLLLEKTVHLELRCRLIVAEGINIHAEGPVDVKISVHNHSGYLKQGLVFKQFVLQEQQRPLQNKTKKQSGVAHSCWQLLMRLLQC